MEVFPYIIDVVMYAFACNWSAANLVRKPGEPTFGLFRYREQARGAKPADKRMTTVQPRQR
jgi:hypothetical protein